MTHRFGVIFHELCHSLFKAQPMALQKELDSWFLSLRTPHAIFAYRYYNEALATALGNGWFTERADANSIRANGTTIAT